MKIAKSVLAQLKRVLVLLLGIPVLILGLILIPLPGPGLILSFLGLIILSQGFEWPKKHTENIKEQIKKIILLAKDKKEKIDEKYK